MKNHQKKRSNLPSRIIDTHAHILPGIDDGARDLETSVEIVRWLAEQGVTDIIATPHYIIETEYVSPKSANNKLLKKLNTELKKAGIKVKLHLGNEIYINDRIKDLIKTKKIAPINDGQYLLIEMSLDDECPNYEDYFYELTQDGYKVILAHPERYAIIQKDYEIARRLYEMGVLLQCNMGSILGKYGSGAKKVVKKLAKDKMIFALGSDAHYPGREDYLPVAWKKLSKFYGDEELRQILELNPAEILKKVAKKKSVKRKTTKKSVKKTTKKSAKKSTQKSATKSTKK